MSNCPSLQLSITLTTLTSAPLGILSSNESRHEVSSFITHSPMCSDTGTEYGTRPDGSWLGLSGISWGKTGFCEGICGSSLTGIGVARGAGMHWALVKSVEKSDE